MFIVFSDRSMSMLEIIDCMEGEEATSAGEMKNQRRHNATPSRSVILETPTDVAAELEESRILDEVFFLSKSTGSKST